MSSRVYLTFVLAVAILSSTVQAQEPMIKIDRIEEDSLIEGKVSNLSNPKDFGIVVYVRTNHWYIHPFAEQGEDRSWTRVNEDGTWAIPTVKYPNDANSVAALLTDLSVAENVPSELTSFNKIKKHAIIIYSKEEMKKNGWHGKI